MDDVLLLLLVIAYLALMGWLYIVVTGWAVRRVLAWFDYYFPVKK